MNKLKGFLIPAIIVSCIFPLRSVFGGAIGGLQFGINVYYTLLLVVAIIIVLPYNRDKILKLDPEVRKIIYGIGIFVFFATLTSFINPYLFEGIKVFSPRGGIDAQVGNENLLKFTASNVGQVVYLILNFFLIIFLLINIRGRKAFLNKVIKYERIALLVLIVFGMWQIANKVTGIYYPYEQLFNLLERGEYKQTVSGFFRINATMREPSDFATVLVSFLPFTFLSFFKTVNKNKYILFALCVIGLIIISTSSTGIIAFSVLVSLLLAVYLFKVISTLKISTNKLFLAITLAIILLAFYYYFFERINQIIYLATLRKTDSASFSNRLYADLFSFKVLTDTYLLGAGLGSNRPSSFITFILSNVGIIGFSIFSYVIFLITKTYWKYRKYDSLLDITFATFITCLFAKGLAGPDLSTEYFWVFLSVLIVNLNLAGRKYHYFRKKFKIQHVSKLIQ